MPKKSIKPTSKSFATGSAVTKPVSMKSSAAPTELSGLSEPPMPPTDSVCLKAANENIVKMEKDEIAGLNEQINELRKSWDAVVRKLVPYKSNERNDQWKTPPAMAPFPKFPRSDEIKPILTDHIRQLKPKLAKLQQDLEKFDSQEKKKHENERLAAVKAKKELEEQLAMAKAKQEEDRKRGAQRRKKFIIIALIAILVAIVVIAVALTLGLFFGLKSSGDGKTTTTMSGKDEPKPDGQTGEAATTKSPFISDYEIACKSHVKPGEEECFVGSAPGSCDVNATCWQMQLAISGNVHIGFKFTSKVFLPTPPPSTGDRKRMCKADDDRIGSCNDNDQCNAVGGPIDKSLYEPAEWKDNCDEPNPCWGRDDEWGKFVPAEYRENCKKLHCNAHDQAVIWMQHVRCHAGNGRTANETCKGLPLRLWLCKPCVYDEGSVRMHLCDRNQGVRPVAGGDGCMVECGAGTRWEPKVAPNGFNCTADDGQPGHCFKGQCFPIAEVYDPVNNKLPDLEQCKAERDADKKKEGVFVRGRREAINVDFTANVRPMPEDESTQTDASKKLIEFPKEPEEVEEKPYEAE